MIILTSKVTKLLLTELDRLDPVTVIAEDIGPSQGKITIDCYGQSWTAYWGGMGKRNIQEFFCSCDEHYIAKNLSSIPSDVYDVDTLREQADKKGVVYSCRDEPWNDYDFMDAMYGGDAYNRVDSLPKMVNPEYDYLCRIIKTVQGAFKQL